MLLGGLLLLQCGGERYRQSALVRNTPTERVRSIALGRTKLTGIARADDRPFDQPFGDGKCIYANWKIEERSPDSWRTLERGTLSDQFLLEDETGTVLVRSPHEDEFETVIDYPRGANVVSCTRDLATVTISDENTLETTVDGGERPSEAVVEWLQGLELSPTTGNHRRYTQKVMPPETDVQVLGTATRDESIESPRYENDLVIERDEASGLFHLADIQDSHVTSSYFRSSLMMLGLGLALSAGGLTVLLLGAPRLGLL